MLRFDSRILLLQVSFIAIAIAVFKFPPSFIAVAGTYAALSASPLKDEATFTTCIHNGIIGVCIGAATAAFIAFLIAIFGTSHVSHDADASMLGMPAMLIIPCVFGVLCACRRQRNQVG